MQRWMSLILSRPTLWWNLLLSSVVPGRQWWTEVEPGLYLGALPLARHVPRFESLGIRGVVNTCQEFEGLIKHYNDCGIEQLHVPTVDFVPPSLADIEQSVEFIDRHLAAGDSVYVHCKAGRGRSATVVLCWLLKHRNMSPGEAQAHLLELRRHVNRRLDQRAVVQEYYASCTAHGDVEASLDGTADSHPDA